MNQNLANPVRILMAEDLLTDARLAEREIQKTLQSCIFLRVETREDYIQAIDEFQPDLIVTDYHMPFFDGLSALKLAQEIVPLIPVIILTGAINEDTAVDCMKAGATDYVIKEHIKRLGQAVLRALDEKEIKIERWKAEAALYESEERYRMLAENANDSVFVLDKDGTYKFMNNYGARSLSRPLTEIIGKNLSHIFPAEVATQQKEILVKVIETGEPVNNEMPILMNGEVTWYNTSLACFEERGKQMAMGISRDITQRKLAEEDLRQTHRQLELIYDETIEALTRAIDLRDKETEGHTRRVIDLTVQLARVFGLTDDELIHIRRGAFLHDLGKIGIPDAILHKPSALDEQEWAIMRQHPLYAYNMLFTIKYLQPALDVPYCHHEKWDGTGYPRQLKGEEIPLAARLFAVVDVWDALTNERPYREAWSKERSLDHICNQSGKHFDPAVVEAFKKIIEQEMTLTLS
jgi:PAS domain S-box-containing protein